MGGAALLAHHVRQGDAGLRRGAGDRGGRDVRLALWQRRHHDDRHADARRHPRVHPLGTGRRAGHQRPVQLGRHGDAPERPLRVPADLRRGRAAVLRLGVHPLHRCRRLRAGQHRHAERRGVPGRPAPPSGEAVPRRRDQPGGLGHLRRQLPHPGAELGRSDRVPRRTRQGRAAHAASGAALRHRCGARRDHRHDRSHRAHRARRAAADPGGRVPLRRLLRGRLHQRPAGAASR